MIIAVDFDGTVQLPDKSPNIKLIASLRAAQRRGDTVILWTSREGKSLYKALAFCRERKHLEDGDERIAFQKC